MIEVKDEFLGCGKVKRAVRLAGPVVITVWLALKAYAAKNLTDGFIPSEDVDAVDAYVDESTRHACIKAMLECGRRQPDGTRGAGLLEQTEHGYQLHDYLDHSMSAEEVLRKRGQRAKRQKRWRQKRSVVGVDGVDALQNVYETQSETSTRRVADASRDAAPARPRAPVPQPNPTSRSEGSDPSDPHNTPQDPRSGSLLSSDPDPDQPVRSGSRARATVPKPDQVPVPLPEDWEPDAEQVSALAAKHRVSEERIRAEVPEFRWYWRAGGGAGKRRSARGWAQAFGNRIAQEARRETLYAEPRRHSGAGACRTATDIAFDRVRDLELTERDKRDLEEVYGK